MKKMASAVLVFVFAVSLFAACPVQAKEKGGAAPAILSFFLPGVGEWYNSEYQGTFPFGECIVGSFCFPFMISSVIDASNGADDQTIRFDFWSSPNKKTE